MVRKVDLAEQLAQGVLVTALAEAPRAGVPESTPVADITTIVYAHIMRGEEPVNLEGAWRRIAIGGAIVLGACAMLFWWGWHFNVFGSDIDWLGHPAQLGFPVLIVAGAFGAGYVTGGTRGGFRAMLGVAALLLVAIVIGGVRRAL